jgi:hypothetical protein
MTMNASLNTDPNAEPAARRMWRLAETYHSMIYVTPQSRAAIKALGCKEGCPSYFGSRTAPLGAAPPELVTAIFYNFHPRMVARALPDAWAVASPQQFLAARLAGVDATLRDLLGDETLTGSDLVETAELAGAAAQHAPTAGRPLAAANALQPVPAQPHLALWRAMTVLRESRGDGHVAALVTAELAPCEALVLTAADHGVPGEEMQQTRGWSESEWADAVLRLTERGLLDAGGRLTDAGRELRSWVEERTDAAAQAPWDAVGAEATERLEGLLHPIVVRLIEHNDGFRNNSMAAAMAARR